MLPRHLLGTGSEGRLSTSRRAFIGGVAASGLSLLATPWSAMAHIQMASNAAARRESLDFMVFRDGVEVGHHKLAFSGSGDRVDIDIDIDLEVGFGPITLYRYKHRNLEAWRGSDFMAFESKTDDDGDAYMVRAMADNGNVQVEVSDESESRQFGVDRQALLPSTYWSIDTVRCNRLLDTQEARIFEIAVDGKGLEEVVARGKRISAMRYDMTGDLELSLWYDDEARWVKTTFVLGGAPFEYRLV